MDDLLQLRDRVARLPALENRLEMLVKEIATAEYDVAELLKRYGKKNKDVENIQKESLTSFVFKVLGKYDEKLEKERREAYDAKMEYDRSATRLNTLLQDRDSLNARITELRREAVSYEKELDNRRREVSRRLSDTAGLRYAELETERQRIISQITEIKEALIAAERALSTAETALKALNSAKNWATYDAFARGGILSHMAKYSHIDEAEQCFHMLESQLSSLKSELSDVQGMSTVGLHGISAGQRAIDFWFDNIFTDLSVRGQIQDNADEVSRLISKIRSLMSELENKIRTEEAELERNRQKQEEILISL